MLTLFQKLQKFVRYIICYLFCSISVLIFRPRLQTSTSKHGPRSLWKFSEMILDNPDLLSTRYPISRAMSDDPPLSPLPAPLGCAHYRRKCKLVAPCCGKAYNCRWPLGGHHRQEGGLSQVLSWQDGGESHSGPAESPAGLMTCWIEHKTLHPTDRNTSWPCILR